MLAREMRFAGLRLFTSDADADAYVILDVILDVIIRRFVQDDNFSSY
jgi:hypothetical protein